jgi:glycosyltransferase involved in cell wall biosynthesis
LEALASSTPVLISPGCHFDEVEEFGVGKVVENCSHSIAEAIVQLASNREQLMGMGDRARKLVCEKYSWKEIADSMLSVYEDAIASSRSSTSTPHVEV